MNSANQTPTPLPPDEPQATIPSKPRLSLLLFFTALLAPPVITFLSARSGLKDAPVVWALVGGALGGIVCGVMLGRRFGKTNVSRVMLGILFTLIFAVVCFVMSFAGCMTGGFKVNFH